jgi:AraC-like DNA-binding protein
MANLLRSTNLWGYRDLVRELGGRPEELLLRYRIRPGIENDEEAFVSFAAFAQLLETSAAELGCPDFGLRLAAWQGLDILGPVAVIARNSQTVRSAFDAIARYLFVHSPSLRLTPAEDEDGTDFDFAIDDPALRDRTETPQAYELSLANGARILRLLAGPESRADRVAFLHPRLGPMSSYADAFGCPVLFSQPRCSMRLSGELAGRAIDNADPETRRVATRYLDSQFSGGEVALARRVSELVRRLLPTGHGDAETVAEQLRMHPRTLQRRLAAEGTRYADLLDHERRAQALRLLSQPGLHLSQIAGLLGYSEQSAFNRAFRRWYATSPGRYRASS